MVTNENICFIIYIQHLKNALTWWPQKSQHNMLLDTIIPIIENKTLWMLMLFSKWTFVFIYGNILPLCSFVLYILQCIKQIIKNWRKLTSTYWFIGSRIHRCMAGGGCTCIVIQSDIFTTGAWNLGGCVLPGPRRCTPWCVIKVIGSPHDIVHSTAVVLKNSIVLFE